MDITGDPNFSIRCHYQKAQYFHDNGRYADSLEELKNLRMQDDIPEGFDREQMIFDNKFAVCKEQEDQDETYQCLLDLAHEDDEYRYSKMISGYYKDKNIFYTDEEIGRLLFWRDEINESGPVERLRFPEYMDRCLNNGSYWYCAKDLIFDMVYFAEEDQPQAYQAAVDWAAQEDQTESADWLEKEPKRCIRNAVPSDYTGTAYLIDAPAACNAKFRPELENWFQENIDTSVPAEGFWSSDTFYETFGFDTTAPDFSGEFSIKSRFRAEDPYLQSVAIIVSSGSEFDRPDENWRNNLEMTDHIVHWVNETVAAYKKVMPDWIFIDDPSQAAYILFYSLTWQPSGTFQGQAKGEDIKVKVYNLHISGECWENREHGWRNKIISKESDLGQGYEGKFTPGVTQFKPQQYLTILSEDPLTIYNADYDPETKRAYSINRPNGFSSEMVKWLEEIEAEQTGK